MPFKNSVRFETTCAMEIKTIKVPSQPEQIVAVESFIDEVKTNYEINDEVYGNILICVTEAANNAIIHGNRCNAAKEAEISASLDDRRRKVTFIIRDQGPGFDYNNIPDPTEPENLHKVNGRGVYLMKQLADLVVFSNNGSTVEMQFRI